MHPRRSWACPPRPRRERPPEADEPGIAREREAHCETAGGVDLRLERRGVAERHEDRIAKTLRQQERRDRPDRDRGDDGDAKPTDDRRHRERQLDAEQDLAPGQAHAARRLDHLGGRAPQPGHEVREQDDQRVRDKRDLDCGPRDACERHQELEERNARDGVEEGREHAEGLLEPREAVREQSKGEREPKADADRDRSELDVLDQRRAERVVPVVPHPAPAEDVVARDARVGVPEVRDDRAGRERRHRSSPARSRRNTPRTLPSSSTTVTPSAPASSMWLTAVRTETRELSSGETVSLRETVSNGTCPRVWSAIRRSARSSPTNWATKSSAGCARIASGVSY